MTDAQLAAILSAVTVAAGLIGAAIRWSAGRIIKALDANSASNVALTERLAVFTIRMEDITKFVEENTPVNQPIPKRPKTSPRGYPIGEYAIHRPSTRGEDDE